MLSNVPVVCMFIIKFYFDYLYIIKFWNKIFFLAGECILNCRALGMSFYAQLNRTVWDGTSCTRPLTHNMQLTPPGTRGICVQGECKVSALF